MDSVRELIHLARGRREEGKKERGEEGKKGRREEGKKGGGEEGKKESGVGSLKVSFAMRKLVPNIGCFLDMKAASNLFLLRARNTKHSVQHSLAK